jgi:hypothetical protein
VPTKLKYLRRAPIARHSPRNLGKKVNIPGIASTVVVHTNGAAPSAGGDTQASGTATSVHIKPIASSAPAAEAAAPASQPTAVTLLKAAIERLQKQLATLQKELAEASRSGGSANGAPNVRVATLQAQIASTLSALLQMNAELAQAMLTSVGGGAVSLTA